MAFEAILDTLVPIGEGEREIDWLKRSFMEMGSRGLDLARHTEGSPSPGTWIREQHDAFRCALFHAKATSAGPRRLPATHGERAEVSEALGRLNLLVHDLLGLE